MTLYYDTTNNLYFCTTWQIGKHKNHIFSQIMRYSRACSSWTVLDAQRCLPETKNCHSVTCLIAPNIFETVRYPLILYIDFQRRYMLSPVRLSVCCLSVVCNARTPYSSDSIFRQYFYGIWYLSHPMTTMENLRRLSQGNPSVGGVKPYRGVAKYSDFGPIEGYISETVQDRR